VKVGALPRHDDEDQGLLRVEAEDPGHEREEVDG
jgi:hypothetical protein